MVRKKKAGYRYKAKKRSSSKKIAKRRLAGFTKVKGKYVLVFKNGTKMSIGKSKYSSKVSLQKAAAKYI